MGLYRDITKEETERMKKVLSDNELNELFQEALQYNKDLLIKEIHYFKLKQGYKGWLLGQKVKDFNYQLYFESRAHDGSPHQAQYILFASEDKSYVVTFLYGIINGGLGYRNILKDERAKR